MNCDICEAEPQAIQLGNMQTGDQQFVCVGCAARWGLDFAKAVLPPEEIAAQLGPLFVDPAREDLHEGAKAARKGRKTKAETPPAAAEGEAGGPDEMAAAAENE